MQLRLAIAQQGHTFFAAGHQQGLQVKITDQLLALGNQVLLIFDRAGHRFEFTEIGRQQGGTTVMTEIRTFRIHQYRHAGVPGQGNQTGAITQRPLGIIGQHQRPAVGQLLLYLAGEGRRVLVVERFLEIQPQQLLLTTDDAQLGDGGEAINFLKMTAHFCGTEALLKDGGCLIIAGNAYQLGPGAKSGHIQGHVSRATRTILQLGHPHHRHWRFRRDSPGGAMPITVEHDITCHQNAGLAKSGNVHRFSKTQQSRISWQCSIA